MTGPLAHQGAAVLVPVKGFADAKKRLAGHLTVPQRAALARRMAERVVAAAAPLPVFVVCDRADVRDWAGPVGATPIWSPGRGLNGAVTRGVATLAADGFDRVIVAHADLPLATTLAWVAEGDGATLVPDRHEDGTNVICVPAHSGFRFHYGSGSFAKHTAEAGRLGLAVRVVRDPALGWDVDLPRDLDIPAGLAPGVDLDLVPQEDPCP